ncbi:MAG: T9SS type A sorting domain-containing protein, partial [Cyclobacteriaceae bacterium]
INPDAKFLQFSDNDLRPGKTTYQVQLLTEVGEVLSEKVVLFTTDDKKYILFPNPVTNGELAFLSPVTSAIFQVLDTSGRPLEEFLISAEFEIFPISLSKGVYLYRVIKENQTVNSGRFVIGSSRN